MLGKNKFEKDPASGKPMMRDIVSKKSRPALPPRIAKKEPQEVPISVRKEERTTFKKTEFFIKKEKKRFTFDFRIGKWVYVAGILVISFFFVFFAVGAFSHAKILLTPRQEFMDVEGLFRASADSVGDLSLDEVTMDDEITETGATETSKKSEGKASGQVILYNAFSQTPQLLIKNTRIEASEKIFRIPVSVTIPGAKMEAGKLIPGSIEINAYADKPGPEYNIGLADFTIPGFRGTPKYDKFYARSKTAMEGGFFGTSKMVTAEQVKNLLTKAEADLRNRLREKISRDLPRGIFLPENAVDIKMELLEVNPAVNSEADNFTIKAKGTLRALVLESDEVAKVLSDKYLTLAPTEKTEIANLEKLNFDISGADFENKKMNVKISGQAHFVWAIDEDALKNDLLGASKETREEIFKKYSGIEKAEIDFTPAWWRFFPKDKRKIDIIILVKENP